MEFKFGDKDRARWGLPDEWMPMALDDISMRDLTELSERFNFEPDDWPVVLRGEVPFDKAGQEDAQPVRPRWVTHAYMWMTLHQNGYPIPWDDVADASPYRFLYRAGPEPEPGKDDGTSEPSPTSEPSTTGPSESSST